MGVVRMHSQHKHGDLGVCSKDRRRSDFTTIARQVEVHQHDIWPDGLGDLDGVLGVGRLADDLDVVDPAEKGTKTLSEDHVIVHYYQADRPHSSTGIRA
jgi:hypothetical protein